MYFLNFGFNFVVILKSTNRRPFFKILSFGEDLGEAKIHLTMKFNKLVVAATAIVLAVSFFSFKRTFDDHDWLAYVNRALQQCYDQSTDPKLKKVEISLTPDNFVRLRKTYAKNMQEYYSFNLHRFNDMDYLGSSTSGTLSLKTMADDIIVQTYNDRHGDIDSMTTVLDIPVKNMEPERLDSLREAFNYFKTKGL
jgi:hypothetical protein